MSISITVEGTERKNRIEIESFQVESNLTNQTDICDFDVYCIQVSDWRPSVGDEVKVWDGNTQIFGGIIVKIEKIIDSNGILIYKTQAKDYSQIMDGKLVFKEYVNQSMGDIIADLVSSYMPTGFTANNISATSSAVIVTNISFNYEAPSKCLKALADLINCDWYVDVNKNIHFFEKDIGETAPFGLTDSNGNYLSGSLSITEDLSQIRNVIYVRGGEYAGDSRTDKFGVGDGTTLTFNLPYRYDSTPVITVGGTVKTVGVDFLDSADSFDCLWNYQEKLIKFKTAPASGDILATGKPMIAVIIKAKSGASILQFTRSDFNGEYEYVVIDKTIVTKEYARLRAQAEMNDYGTTVKDLKFDSYTAGLSSGQLINVQSTKLSLNIDFILTRVVTKIRRANTFMYSAEGSTVREMGIIAFLQKQLEDVNKKVGVIKQEGEILDVIVSIEGVDTYTGSDTIIGNHLNSPPTWYSGPYYPASDADRKRAPYADTHCYLAS